MIADMGYEDLGLVLEPPKGARVENPVTITLELEPDIRWVLFYRAPSSRLR
jgi:hypothetical protein